MRELKFRAWDKRTKELIQIQGFKYVGEKHIQLFYFDTDGCSTTCTCEKEFIVLIQYTGLKDKNGTEIFEGDILHAEGYWDIRIEFEIGSFTCRSLDKVQYVNRIVDVPIGKFDLLSKFEVIGNIYENPELLKGRE